MEELGISYQLSAISSRPLGGWEARRLARRSQVSRLMVQADELWRGPQGLETSETVISPSPPLLPCILFPVPYSLNPGPCLRVSR